MLELKPVGIYREMYRSGHADLPSLREARATQPLEDRGRIVQYMTAATPVFDVMGSVTDLLDANASITSGQSLISDGTWLWRVDSIHYLTRYDLEIPAEFVDHVRGRNYRPTADVDLADEIYDAAITAYF
ncbi:hypothetical protein ACFVH4_18000 [Nocardia ignorata]|uniref:hypothetical protein n=1 Tax=Nocardia ignorata TaxID=145285 RepID=UPI003629F8E5